MGVSPACCWAPTPQVHDAQQSRAGCRSRGGAPVLLVGSDVGHGLGRPARLGGWTVCPPPPPPRRALSSAVDAPPSGGGSLFGKIITHRIQTLTKEAFTRPPKAMFSHFFWVLRKTCSVRCLFRSKVTFFGDFPCGFPPNFFLQCRRGGGTFIDRLQPLGQ